MKKAIVFFILFMAFFFFVGPGEPVYCRTPPHLKRCWGMWGDGDIEDKTLFIMQTRLKTDDGKPLHLAHNVFVYKMYGLPMYMKSRQLVLGVRGEPIHVPIPEGEKLRMLQDTGQLPKPLPGLGIVQRLKGHYGWFVLIFGFGLLGLVAPRRTDERQEAL
jgi:hypothetical protein